MMKFFQHYYTSCKEGLCSTQGWQTKSKSKGINDNQMKELEDKFCSYKIPRGNDQFTAEGQPVSFRYHRLNAGQFVLTHIKYIGQNFEDRPGNYFAHNLVAFNNQLKEIDGNPFRLYYGNHFIDADVGKATDNLPPLELEVKPDLERERRVLGFLNTHFDMDRIRLFLDAVLSNDRRIILAYAEETGRFQFMEGILLLLPYAFRSAFSFATYHHAPQKVDYRCTGILPGKTSFKFLPEDYGHRYYVFNFGEVEKFSKVPQSF
ncbi:MAG: hypothetical protein GY765_02650, partial [bacterium]|nr:hypothetical protein [bacterium]